MTILWRRGEYQQSGIGRCKKLQCSEHSMKFSYLAVVRIALVIFGPGSASRTHRYILHDRSHHSNGAARAVLSVEC